jgi:sarcosine oxidase gamma subunit
LPGELAKLSEHQALRATSLLEDGGVWQANSKQILSVVSHSGDPVSQHLGSSFAKDTVAWVSPDQYYTVSWTFLGRDTI